MTSYKSFLFIFINFIVINAQISDRRLCADPNCSEPVSLAKTLIRYNSPDRRILSFLQNVDVTVYSKSAGSRTDLWGVEINGKRGYVPISHIRETKILKTNEKLVYLVSTEEQEDVSNNSTPTIPNKNNPNLKPTTEAHSVQEKISPNSVTASYEVIDGTTIYLNEPTDSVNSISDTTTPSSILDSKIQQSEISSAENVVEATEPVTPDPKLFISDLKPEEKTLDNNEQIKKNSGKSEQNVINKEEDPADDEDAEIEDEEDDGDEEDEDFEEDEDEYGENSTEILQEKIETNSNENSNNASVITTSIMNEESADHKEEINKSEAANNIDDDNKKKEEKKLEETTEKTIVNSPVTVEQDTVGVPSIQTSSEEVNEKIKNETPQTQVPENLLDAENASLPSPEINLEFIPTTEATVHEIPLPLMDAVVTENPVEILQTPIPEKRNLENLAIPTSTEIPLPPDKPIEMLQPETLPLSGIVDESKENIISFKSGDILVENVGNSAEQNIVSNTNHLELNNENIKIDTSAENLMNIDIPNKSTNLESENVNNAFVENKFNDDHVPHEENKSTNLESENVIENKFNDDYVNVQEVSENKIESVENDVKIESAEDASAENMNEESGFFSNIYNSVFGNSEDNAESVYKNTVQQSESENIIENVEVSTEKAPEVRANIYEALWNSHHAQEKPVEKYLPPLTENAIGESQNIPQEMQTCDSIQDPTCGVQTEDLAANSVIENLSFEIPENAYSTLLYLGLTSITVLLFTLGYYYLEKKRQDSTLVAVVNTLEKKLLISSKECFLLHDELKTTKDRLLSIEDSSFGSNEMVNALKQEIEEGKIIRFELEEQIANLEKELENATEAGMELNRMLREILSTQSGNEHLMQNIEQLQRQLNEQQVTINTMNNTLSSKNTENELLQIELSVANEKINQLQIELDKMVVNLLSVQEEKSKIENDLEDQIIKLKSECDGTIKELNSEVIVLKDENHKLKSSVEETQRSFELKSSEYTLFKDGMKDLKEQANNKESLKALLDVSSVKAEMLQLRDEKNKMSEKLQKECDTKLVLEKEVLIMMQEIKILKAKFDDAEREKVEAQTRLEVLSGYFNEKEAQLQKEINENESKWMQKEGEASSTIERIKWIQDELQNYKSQNELLKKEILDQEVSLKSQISMLEKKSHDNWLLARQAERRLEESKQDASQLRNRLTIVEKNLNNSTQLDESKLQNRIMSPLELNGELPVSPLHMSNAENPGSPPLLYPPGDHMTTSPPIPGLPPFMPPPPGVPPFMPPPMSGVPPFMPRPSALYPGDHRPPPLGRMSSPPLHGRYSPDSRAYSPYDRDDSPPLSPSYPDNDYRRRSPPPPPPPSSQHHHHIPRNYSPYSGGGKRATHWDRDDDYRGQYNRNKPRTHKGLSSGSGNSNESLDNSGRHSGRV